MLLGKFLPRLPQTRTPIKLESGEEQIATPETA